MLEYKLNGDNYNGMKNKNKFDTKNLVKNFLS